MNVTEVTPNELTDPIFHAFKSGDINEELAWDALYGVCRIFPEIAPLIVQDFRCCVIMKGH